MDEDRGLNYFNYFTEVEEAFVRRRGAHLLVSPMDWALIESWKDVGIPLHVVLRAIDSAFDAFDSRPHPHRRVNSIFYCQQAVESAFEEYRKSLVGSEDAAAEAPAWEFPRGAVEAYLDRAAEDLAAARLDTGPGDLAEALGRADERLAEIRASVAGGVYVNTENLERELTGLEALIERALVEHGDPGLVEEARKDAKKQLKPHRKEMDKSIYQQTFDRFVVRSLRERYRVPRLSLFFMD
jgi:hypothetical protein